MVPIAVTVCSVLAVCAPRAVAQRVSVGVVVGGYANSDFRHLYQQRGPGFPPLIVESDSGGYVVGPSLDFRLNSRLSLGVEALYKPLRYKEGASFRDNAVIGYAPATVITWQFPVLAKYRLSTGRVRPFLEAGPSLRSTGNLNSANPSHYGVTAGIGAETDWRSFRIAPRVRYTRWADDPASASARTRADQVEFLVGVGYVGKSDFGPLGRRISLGVVFGSAAPINRTTLVMEAIGPSGSPVVTESTSWLGRFVVGPMVEVDVLRRLSIEFNAINRSFRSNLRIPLGNGQTFERSYSHGYPWEFPVFAKYRLSTGSVRPFVAAGPSFRLPKDGGRVGRSNYAVATGAGVEFDVWKLKMSPTVRYARWGADRLNAAGIRMDSGIPRNQVQILFGISF